MGTTKVRKQQGSRLSQYFGARNEWIEKKFIENPTNSASYPDVFLYRRKKNLDQAGKFI